MTNADPTRTILLRRAAVREVNKRYNGIARVLLPTVKNAMRKDEGVLLGNARAGERSRFVYKTDGERIVAFRQWMQEQIDDDLLTNKRDGEHWLLAFIASGYTRGATAFRRKLGVKFLRKYGFATDGYNPLTNPKVLRSAEILYARAYEQLRGVTDTMAQQISRELSDGLLRGDNPTVVAKAMRDRVNKIGKVRSRLIARTEIIRAYSLGGIAEGDNLGEMTGNEIRYRWIAALDSRVRDKHRHWHGKIFTRQEVLNRIGEPNCRCTQAPYLPDYEEA